MIITCVSFSTTSAMSFVVRSIEIEQRREREKRRAVHIKDQQSIHASEPEINASSLCALVGLSLFDDIQLILSGV